METDPTKLTSFQPISPIPSPSGFSIAKLFNSFNKRTDSLKNASAEQGRNDASSSKSNRDGGTFGQAPHGSKDHIYSWLSNYEPTLKENESLSDEINPSARKEKWRYRNVRTILRRLSAFTIDRRWHQTTGDFKHNFKQYWMPDEHCKECYECSDKFNTFRRRHHCRVCGQIFCYRCCGQEVAGKVIGFTGDIRVCNYCHKIVHAYLSDDMEKSIEALSEDIRVCDPNYGYEYGGSNGSMNSMKSTYNDDPVIRMKKTSSTNSLTNVASAAERASASARSPFDAFGVTPSEANTIKQDYLRELWKQMNEPGGGLELLDHRYKSKTYDNCLIASDLCDWMIKSNKATNSDEAVCTGQALLENGWIEHVIPTNQIAFKDEYIIFQPTKMAIQEIETARMRSIMFSNSDDSHESHPETDPIENAVKDDDAEAPIWFKQVNDMENVEHPPKKTKNVTRNRGFSTARHLDLDRGLTSTEEDTATEEYLSLQMKIQSSQQDKDILDESNKISFITNAPPLPLDSYVCVEGHQPMRGKLKKIVSASNLPDDILKGVVFPRSTALRESDVEGVGESGKDEGGERLAKDRLNAARHHHVHALLQQLLKHIKLSPTWGDIIMPFLSEISEKVVPDVVKGDDMDIRQYVWITKVPGGLKTDTHSVSGVVFRKNISHKRMASFYKEPKILMMSCAIEYQRVELKMSSLDPLVLQEYAFLQNFVKRVLDVKPNLLLVEKNVARVAQDMLLAGGVTLIHNVKPEKMECIRRCTGAEILQKMEQVTRPKLGTCKQFRAQKYLLPNGQTKTLIYLDGCAADLGCSLVLRGGHAKALAEVKKLVKYFVYVCYHLKLEAKFLMDEFAMPPPLDKLTPQMDPFEANVEDEAVLSQGGSCCNEKQSNESEADRFQLALNKVVLSSSPFCNYSVPYLLTKDGNACPTRQFIADQIYSSNYLSDACMHQEQTGYIDDEEDSTVISSSKNSNVVMKPLHSFTDPAVLINCIENKDSVKTILNDFRAQGGQVHLKMYKQYEEQEIQKIYGKSFMRKMSEIGEYIKDQEDEKDSDSKKVIDPKDDCFDAYNHQKIAVLFSSYSQESENFPKPCISPWAVFMVFYGTHDITLGGFLERYCFRPSYICSDRNCDVPMVKHIRYFAHGSGSLHINMRNLDTPIPGYDRTILTWSWCKICQQVTPVVPLSFECWSLSFAKYLELRFYGSEYTRRASAEPCGHSLHHDHYQYFSFGKLAASFKYRPISLHEIVLPAFTVRIGNQRKPRHLMDEVEEIHTKIESVTATIMDRINELRSEDSNGSNIARESKLKEFLSDLQKEQSNLEDCIAVVKCKTEQLLNASFEVTCNKKSPISPESNSFVDLESTHVEPPKSNTNGRFELAAPVEAENGGKLIVGSVPMTGDEIHVLVADVGKKLFHLKKSICESVESWNMKLQEFVTQDRKKEKGLAQSASPSKAIVPPGDGNEFYLDGEDASITDADINRPKTITHMHPEPVSEVHLTDGTILRQTYLGTAPRSASPYLPDQTNSSTKLEKGDEPTTSQKVPTTLDVKSINNANQVKAMSSLVCSPYQLLENPGSSESLTKAAAKDHSDDGLSKVIGEKSTAESIDDDKSCTGTSDAGRSTDDSVPSDSELSLKVECYSDRDDFSDNQSLHSEDDDTEFNFSESEVFSDCDIGDDELNSDSIKIGQSAVDFANLRFSRDSVSSKRRLRNVSHLSGFTEFPKIKEETVGKFEYLTPKEAKAMQVQRRLRTEWESRIRIGIDNDNLPPYISPPKSREFYMKNRSISLVTSPSDISQLQRVYSSPNVNKPVKLPRPWQTNPLIKRLVQDSCDTFDVSEEVPNDSDRNLMNVGEGVTILPSCSTTDIDCGHSKSISASKKLLQDASITNEQFKANFDDVKRPKISISHKTSNEVSLEKSNEFPKQKNIGHRRLKSAPAQPTEVSEIEVPSDLGHGAPFIFVNPKQKELYKMAEQFCEEERKDDERDIPEVLMYEGSKKKSTSKDGGQVQDEPKSSEFISENLDVNMNFGKSKSDLELNEGRYASGDASAKRVVGGGDKMKRMITNLLPGPTYQPIPRPFPSWEQYMPQVEGTACIVINEKEPASLIAFTLSSKDYLDQLHVIQDVMAGKKVKLTVPNTPNTSLPASPDIQRKNDPGGNIKSIRQSNLAYVEVTHGVEHDDSPSTSAVSSTSGNPTLKSVGRHPLSSTEFDSTADGPLINDDLPSCDDIIDDGTSSVKSGEDTTKKKEDLSSPDVHIKLQFQNNTAKFYCSVYYAEQFRQLRELIFPEGEERYIQSLARCKFWKATGGKSGSSFSKSLDDRFVMKQMSRLEVQSFVDFGPRYFSYIINAVKEKRPTAIAKLLGVYRIGFKSSDSSKPLRQDVLVMENLFYNKKVNKIYDLKGSVRSRYVQSSTKEDVLMDENLLETICDNPLFIRPHGKAVLSKAIYNDTEFLATNMVMDYSLLVGIDEANLQLVVGIIDYIRTYTWDKKLESYVKSTGILGQHRKMPTVVSPDVYRLRFTAAMTQHYFLMVPDKWTGFGEDIS